MKTIPRHPIDLELAEERAEANKGLLAELLEAPSAELTVVLSTARGYAGYLSVLPLEINLLCSSMKTGSRSAGAMFAAAGAGPTDTIHPGNWRTGWWMAQIVCDREAISQLAATPVDVLRRSSTRGDECQYLFVEALQAFEQRADDWSAKLRRAVDATDPARVDLSDEEFVLNILVPEMELLFRLANGEIEPFNETLHFALERHKKYWSRASRKRDPDGFLALGPIAIGGLARRAGMPIEVQSEYLPKHLVEGACC